VTKVQNVRAKKEIISMRCSSSSNDSYSSFSEGEEEMELKMKKNVLIEDSMKSELFNLNPVKKISTLVPISVLTDFKIKEKEREERKKPQRKAKRNKKRSTFKKNKKNNNNKKVQEPLYRVVQIPGKNHANPRFLVVKKKKKISKDFEESPEEFFSDWRTHCLDEAIEKRWA